MRTIGTVATSAVLSLLVVAAASCSFVDDSSAPQDSAAPGEPGGSVDRDSPLVTGNPTPTPAPELEPIELDCTAGSANCPPIHIAGDPIYSLPDWHGFSDPTVSRDPVTGRLWMAYSWLSMAFTPKPGGGSDPEGVVDIHLAYSDDNGLNWQFDSVLYKASYDVDPGGTSAHDGYVSHEVVTMVNQQTSAGTKWYAAHLQYFLKTGPKLRHIKGDSWTFVVTSADSPKDIGKNSEALLAGALTADGWGASVNLSEMAPELANCSLWTEPALFFEGDTLYLSGVCMVWDTEYHTELGKVVLFATEPVGAPNSWSWRYVGELAGPDVAAELGGDNLLQTEFARTRDGQLIVFLTPNHYDEQIKLEVHHGSWVLDVESLDPPVLARNNDGSLKVRAIITASDLDLLGPGACAYEPSLETGVLFVRRDLSAQEKVWSIHATGIHP